MRSYINQTTEASLPDDGIASGSANIINRVFFRFLDWLFRGPHFPSEPIWTLTVLSLTEICLQLMRQQPEFWTDPSVSANISFLGTPLSWGGWLVLALHVGYILPVGFALRNINLKLAFPIWVTLCLLHMLGISNSFACWTTPAFRFFEVAGCSQRYVVGILLIGIFWSLALGRSVRLGYTPITSGSQHNELTMRYSFLQLFSISWMALLAVGLGITTTPAKPEWKPIQAEQEPSARMFAALGYDSTRQTAILFGGTAAWTQDADWIPLGDTWQWDGNNWELLSPMTNPPPRRNSNMAYDPARGVLVMFGGRGQDAANASVYLNDTWEWDGKNWTERQPAIRPPGRDSANLYYDSQRQKIVLYAGYYQDNVGQNIFLDDLWEWDGQNWTKMELEQSRADSSATLLYYEPEQRPLLMDGQGLWALQDLRWFQPNFPLMPPARWAGSLAFEMHHRQVVLYGGYQGQEVFSDTWTYEGTSWKKLTVKQSPPARYGSNLFFDRKRNRLVLFGGYDGKTLYNDQWELMLP